MVASSTSGSQCLQATETDFEVAVMVAAYEGEAAVSRREWVRTIPRRLG